jgi:hypothetical protein
MTVGPSLIPAGTRWRKSSRSEGATNCVEVALAPGMVGVRDSKLGSASPVITAPAASWSMLTAALSRAVTSPAERAGFAEQDSSSAI